MSLGLTALTHFNATYITSSAPPSFAPISLRHSIVFLLSCSPNYSDEQAKARGSTIIYPDAIRLSLSNTVAQESGVRISKRSRAFSLGATSTESSNMTQVSVSLALGPIFNGPFSGCAVGGNNNSNEIFNAGRDDQLEAIGTFYLYDDDFFLMQSRWIGRELKVIKDDNLGTFESLSFSIELH
ncbi:hypothetical protein GALMADRAFT_1157580 [Galerina marginata CBS 339.88]|uniref:Uncharacterized protein n=1 Tax=Galerina marginata (strain CBS 339.88) TaxID=685588 RepID=A0A067SHT3_GALM3|nr:hypothetical protein GALMADRAFT_1157580 [Galerina marginata CBS 339.88]